MHGLYRRQYFLAWQMVHKPRLGLFRSANTILLKLKFHITSLEGSILLSPRSWPIIGNCRPFSYHFDSSHEFVSSSAILKFKDSKVTPKRELLRTISRISAHQFRSPDLETAIHSLCRYKYMSILEPQSRSIIAIIVGLATSHLRLGN